MVDSGGVEWEKSELVVIAAVGAINVDFKACFFHDDLIIEDIHTIVKN